MSRNHPPRVMVRGFGPRSFSWPWVRAQTPARFAPAKVNGGWVVQRSNTHGRPWRSAHRRTRFVELEFQRALRREERQRPGAQPGDLQLRRIVGRVPGGCAHQQGGSEIVLHGNAHLGLWFITQKLVGFRAAGLLLGTALLRLGFSSQRASSLAKDPKNYA